MGVGTETTTTTTRASLEKANQTMKRKSQMKSKVDATEIPRLSGGMASSWDSNQKASQQQVWVREKLFPWHGESYKIETASRITNKDNQQPLLLPDGHKSTLAVRGQFTALSNVISLFQQDGENNSEERDRLVAVCVRKVTATGQTFTMYNTQPNCPGQGPSRRQYEGQTLYLYAHIHPMGPSRKDMGVFVEHGGERSSSALFYGTPAYVIQRTGSLFSSRKRVIRQHRDSEPIAWIEKTRKPARSSDSLKSYLLTTSASAAVSVDLCLMTFLTVICNELDARR